MKKTIRVGIASAIIILLGFTFRPIKNIEESQCEITNGTVVKIAGGGEKDILFYLENDELSYYVNRGEERGLDHGLMKDTVPGKTVTIWYVHYYSTITWLSSTKHISKLKIGESVVFNELVDSH